ncbi:MAG: hypothetical protein JSR80_02685 [Verrucomicrobia bacterium]|nr:hypothetical protein [Verrucomicrobiota bacterium]
MRRFLPLFLLLFLVLCGCVALSFNWVTLHIVKFALERQMGKLFGEKLRYRTCLFEGHTLRLEEVSCSPLTVQHLELEVSWPLHFRLLLDHPALELERPLQKLKSRKGLPISWEIEVVEGKLGQASGLGGTLKGGKGKRLEGFLHGENFSSSLSSERCLFELEQFDGSILAKLMGVGQVLQGEASGKIAVCLDRGDSPYLEGQLLVTDLHLESERKVHLHLPQVKLLLQPGLAKVGTVGTIHLLEPALLSCDRWRVEALTGGATFDDHVMTLALGGALRCGEVTCALEAVGRASLGTPRDFALDLTWCHPFGASASTQISISGGETSIELIHLGSEHVEVLRSLGALWMPELASVEFKAQNLTAAIRLCAHQLFVERFEAEELQLLYPSKGLAATCALARGDLKSDMRRGVPLHRLTGSLMVAGGKVIYGKNFALEEVEADLVLKKGHLKKGQVRAQYAGMQTTVRRDPLLHKGKLTLELSGSLEGLASLIPAEWSGAVLPKFRDDHFKLNAFISQEGPTLVLEGLCEVDPARLPFSARLRSQPLSHANQHPLSHPMQLRPWAKLVLDLAGLQPHPHALLGTVVPHAFWLAEAKLEGENLDADKYLAPFLLPKKNLELNGAVDLVATYDGSSIDMELAGRSLRLFGNCFEIYVPTTGDLHPGASYTRKAFYHLDLASGHRRLTLPIQGGIYKERSTGLKFFNTRCQVKMLDNHFEITQVTTECEGALFHGELNLTCFPELGRNHLEISAPHVEGKVSSVEQILRKICHRPLWEGPFEGQFKTVRTGLELEMVFGPDRQVLANLEGQISQGLLQVKGGMLSHASLDVGYCHATRELLLSNVCGYLNLGAASLALRNGAFCFHHFPLGKREFHFDLFKESSPWAHLKGKCTEGVKWELEFDNRDLHVTVNGEGNRWNIEQCALGLVALDATLVVQDHLYSFEHLHLTQGERSWYFQRLPPFRFDPQTLQGSLACSQGGVGFKLGQGGAVELWTDPGIAPENRLRLERNAVGVTACGQLGGLVIDLHPTSLSTWKGKISCDLINSLALLPAPLHRFVQLFRLGTGYSLSGQFALQDRGLAFEGDLLGENVSLLGYWWDKLEARASFGPQQFRIEGILLEDQAGHLEINQIQGWKRDRFWEFQVPLIKVAFLRPSNLRRTDGRVQKKRPFTIVRGEAHHIFGTSLGKASWTGLGSFTFNNHRRRNSVGTPFELPDQILGKLGLDPSNMIPSVGRITFHLHDGKMILSDFDEVYSRARRSQFFLSDDSPSYIDLDGHLHLRVRTKQHNLLLKLTESLTIGVSGTLDNPQYSLQRIPKQRPDFAMGM